MSLWDSLAEARKAASRELLALRNDVGPRLFTVLDVYAGDVSHLVEPDALEWIEWGASECWNVGRGQLLNVLSAYENGKALTVEECEVFQEHVGEWPDFESFAVDVVGAAATLRVPLMDVVRGLHIFVMPKSCLVVASDWRNEG